MTKEEFKKLWEADEDGSGITFDDIADSAKEWGLFDYPKRCDINIVRYMKAYTDLEQSKKLETFLPIESADMHYSTWTMICIILLGLF